MTYTSTTPHRSDRKGRSRTPRRLNIQRISILLLIFLPFKTLPVPPTPSPDLPWIGESVLDTGILNAPEYTGCSPQYPGVVNAGYEQEVVELVNEERATTSLPPLKRVTQLDQAARYHAADMYQDDYFAHDSKDRSGSSYVIVCAWSTRIGNFYTNRNWLGENIAWGYGTPQAVMAGWKGSPGHYANIMRPEFTEIGVGYYTGSIWVQDFGSRNGVYPLVINREAAETDDRNVSLYIYGNTTTWTEMRLRNNSLAWTGWMPFQNNLPWQLPDTIGSHTVTVEMRKGSSTTSSNDSIYLSVVTTPTLGNLTESFEFTYSIADARFQPAETSFTPLNISNELALTWQSTSQGGWFSVTPESGATPGSFTVTPQGSYNPPGSHSGSVTITVTNPSGTIGSPHTIDLILTILDGPFNYDYLPLLRSGAP